MGLFGSKLRRNALLGISGNQEQLSATLVARSGDTPPILEYFNTQKLADPGELSQGFKQLGKQRKLKKVGCNLLLDRSEYQLLQIDAPNVPAQERADAIRWRLKERLDFPVEEAAIDVFDMPSRKGQEPMLYAVVARENLLNQRIKALENAGLHLLSIDIPEMALCNIASLLPEDASGVALVHFDANGGHIILARQSILYLSRRLDIGSKLLIEAAMDGEVSPILEGRLDRIVIEIQRSLDYYESHFALPPVAGIVITPMSMPIDGMTDYLSSQLDLSVRILELSQLIDSKKPLPEIQQADWVIALGAALREEVAE